MTQHQIQKNPQIVAVGKTKNRYHKETINYTKPVLNKEVKALIGIKFKLIHFLLVMPSYFAWRSSSNSIMGCWLT